MFLLRLRKILLFNKTYYLLIILTLILLIIRISFPRNSIYHEGNISIKSTVTKITIDGNKLTLNINAQEQLIATYYFKDKKEKDYFKNNINLGDSLLLEGTLIEPKSNTTKYLFNYKKYLNNKHIYFLLKISNYKKLSSNKNIYYYIKQSIINYFNYHPYLNAFILGDKSYISTKIQESYQKNGISHIFAISGMHISLISSILLKILNKFLKEEKSYLITSIILIIYLSLVGISPSILRGVLFFILFSINKIFYFYIKTTNIFLLTLSITLLIDPFFIFDIGFQFSFLISFTLIYMSDYLKGNYIISLLKVSLLSFIVSIPISLLNFYSINLLGIIYNIFFVPLVSIIIFPLTLLTAFIPLLTPLLDILIFILEKTSLFLSKIDILNLIFIRLPRVVYIIYLFIVIYILISIKQSNYKPLIIFIIILLIHYIYPSLNKSNYLIMLDVGQGDCLILKLNNEVVLIDTGGKEMYTSSN